MRILVTGAAGYVGSAVVNELATAGHEVVALAYRSEPRVSSRVQLRRGSILDPDSLGAAVKGVDGVVHLAALTRVRDAVSKPRLYYRANVLGTLNLLDALAAETARTGSPLRLVFSSTGAVYGRAVDQPIRETAPMDPLNAYASTKIAAEDLIRWQAATGDLGATTLRLFNVAGAVNGRGDTDLSRIVPKTAAVALGYEAEVMVNGDGTAIRDFVHVADVAKAVATGLETCEPGQYEVFNVGAYSSQRLGHRCRCRANQRTERSPLLTGRRTLPRLGADR